MRREEHPRHDGDEVEANVTFPSPVREAPGRGGVSSSGSPHRLTRCARSAPLPFASRTGEGNCVMFPSPCAQRMGEVASTKCEPVRAFRRRDLSTGTKPWRRLRRLFLWKPSPPHSLRSFGTSPIRFANGRGKSSFANGRGNYFVATQNRRWNGNSVRPVLRMGYASLRRRLYSVMKFSRSFPERALIKGRAPVPLVQR